MWQLRVIIAQVVWVRFFERLKRMTASEPHEVLQGPLILGCINSTSPAFIGRLPCLTALANYHATWLHFTLFVLGTRVNKAGGGCDRLTAVSDFHLIIHPPHYWCLCAGRGQIGRVCARARALNYVFSDGSQITFKPINRIVVWSQASRRNHVKKKKERKKNQVKIGNHTKMRWRDVKRIPTASPKVRLLGETAAQAQMCPNKGNYVFFPFRNLNVSFFFFVYNIMFLGGRVIPVDVCCTFKIFLT